MVDVAFEGALSDGDVDVGDDDLQINITHGADLLSTVRIIARAAYRRRWPDKGQSLNWLNSAARGAQLGGDRQPSVSEPPRREKVPDPGDPRAPGNLSASVGAGDGRILLLLDVNGVLLHRPASRKSYCSIINLRPGLEHLASLTDIFRLGIYTSATSRTAATVLREVEQVAFPEQVAAGAGARSAGAPARDRSAAALKVFEVLLTRDHCRNDPSWADRPDGNAWDTVKPLAEHDIPVDRCIVVDDSARKILPHERGNAIILPPWLGTPEPAEDAVVDGVLPVLRVLCALLTHACAPLRAAGDVRTVLPRVQQELDEARTLPL